MGSVVSHTARGTRCTRCIDNTCATSRHLLETIFDVHRTLRCPRTVVGLRRMDDNHYRVGDDGVVVQQPSSIRRALSTLIARLYYLWKDVAAPPRSVASTRSLHVAMDGMFAMPKTHEWPWVSERNHVAGWSGMLSSMITVGYDVNSTLRHTRCSTAFLHTLAQVMCDLLMSIPADVYLHRLTVRESGSSPPSYTYTSFHFRCRGPRHWRRPPAPPYTPSPHTSSPTLSPYCIVIATDAHQAFSFFRRW